MEDMTRRRVLLGTTVIAALSAGCLSEDSTQGTASTQPGSADESIDLLDAMQVLVGDSPTGRPLISNESTTIYVDPDEGEDSAAGTEDAPVKTIQEAVDRVPIYLRHQYTIDLATVADTPVTYNEDVLVPSITGTGQAGQEDGASQQGPFRNLDITGQTNDSEAVRIGSLMFGNVIGTSAAHVQFVTITRDSPYDDEQYGICAYGTGEVTLYNIQFTDGPTSGILAYGSSMKASFIDLGQRNVDWGIHAKRHGSIIAREIDGEVTGPAYASIQNSKVSIKEGNRVTGNPQTRTRVGGLIFDQESNEWSGFDTTQ